MDLTPYTPWITASVWKFVDSRRNTLPMYVEGQNRKTQDENLYIEVRLDGPVVCPCGSAGEYRFTVELNILVSCTYDEKDVMKLKKAAAIVIAMLNSDICVLKYGSDESYVGTLQLVTSDEIQFSDFGRIEPTNEVHQGSVEAHYIMYLP
jgi:hypothetical protein